MHTISVVHSGDFERLEVSPKTWFFFNHQPIQRDHAAHTHNYLELAFVLKGDARHISVGGESECMKGCVFIVPQGAWHAYAQCKQLELMNCLFSPQMLAKELAWLADDPVLSRLLVLGANSHLLQVTKLEVPMQHFPKVKSALFDLQAAYRNGVAKPAMVACILQLFEHLRPFVHIDRSDQCESEFVVHSAINRGLEVLRSDISGEWTLLLLAEKLNLNHSYLARLFRAHVGMPPMRYLAHLRAERAATLLLTTRLRINEVGELVGWPEPKLFSRKFHQHYGMSAGQYRARILEMLN